VSKEKKNEKRNLMKKQMYVSGEDLGDNIEQEMELLKYQYDLIIIDTFMEEKMEWNARLSKLSDITLFVIEASYFGNIKAKLLWDRNRFALEPKKVKVVFNRYSKYNLYKTRLMQNFPDFSILGFISERKCYAKNINLSHPKRYGGWFEKKEYLPIMNRIFHPEKMSEEEWKKHLKRK